MSRRRRSTSQPQFIQLQPYRALVGVPVKSLRAGVVHAFVGGALKGALFALIPLAVVALALVYRHGGLDQWMQSAATDASWAGLVIAACALICGTISLARR